MPPRLGSPRLMDIKAKDPSVLQKYLLGNMSPEEQEELELWLMSNEDAYDLMEAAEDDLIDASLAGRLSADDLNRFNTHFLAAPERRRKVQFSRSFRRAIDAFSPTSSGFSPSTPSSTWTRLLDALRYRPALAFASSALVLLLVITSVASLIRTAQLQRELNSVTNRLASSEGDRENLRGQLEKSQSAEKTLQAQLDALQGSNVGPKSSSAPVLLALSLMPGITRSSSNLPQITLTPAASGVQFSLVLTDDNFAAYRASLMNADGREILSRDKIAPTASREGKTVKVTIPAENFATGDYSFGLFGIPASGVPENVGRYYFHAVRQ